MKLLELLREQLTAFPDNNCVAIAQDGNGNAYYWQVEPVFNDEDDEWQSARGQRFSSVDLVDGDHYFLTVPGVEDPRENEVCEDYKTAIITREMFYNQSATSEPVADIKSSPEIDLIAWRDRIIEIKEQQRVLATEHSALVSKIERAGFSLNLAGLRNR